MSQFDVIQRRRVRTLHGRNAYRLATLAAAMIGAASLVGGGLAERVDASETSGGRDAASEFSVQVAPDRRTLEFSGSIVVGVTERVLAVLDAHPDVTTVRLTSPGGRVVEARDLADALRARGITTVAAGNCASACTIIFMAGRERLLAPAGNIGFHRYRSPDPAQEEAQANMAIDRRVFRSQGVPNWFLDQAFDTPNSEMWRPSLAEMRLANIVTGEVDVDGQRTTGVSVNDVSVRTRPLPSRLSSRYARAASDEAILAATTVAAETMRALQARSADACYRYIRPSDAPADLSAIPPHLQQREVASTVALIETGAQGAVPATGSSAQADYDWLRRRLTEEFGEAAEVLDQLGDRRVDHATACSVVTRLYEHALSLPAPRNAQLLRLVLAAS